MMRESRIDSLVINLRFENVLPEVAPMHRCSELIRTEYWNVLCSKNRTTLNKPKTRRHGAKSVIIPEEKVYVENQLLCILIHYLRIFQIMWNGIYKILPNYSVILSNFLIRLCAVNWRLKFIHMIKYV